MAKRNQKSIADLKVRMREPLRAKLEASAKARGVSMNADAVERLERSFLDQHLMVDAMDLAYGAQLTAVLLMLGRVMRDAGPSCGFATSGTAEGADSWLSNPWAFDEATKGAVAVLEQARPPGEVVVPKTYDGLPDEARHALQNPGLAFAAGIIEAVRNPDRGGEIGRAMEPVRERLGDLAKRLRSKPLPSRSLIVSPTVPSARKAKA